MNLEGKSKLNSSACTHVLSVAQSCPTLCDSMDRSPPGCSVHGIVQVRTQEQVDISSSRGSTQGSNPHLLCLLHQQVYFLPLSYLGSPETTMTLTQKGLSIGHFIQQYKIRDDGNRRCSCAVMEQRPSWGRFIKKAIVDSEQTTILKNFATQGSKK